MESKKETPTAVTDGVAELEEYSLENGYSECTVHIGNDGNLRLIKNEESELIERREEIEYRNAVIAVGISVVSIIISIAAIIIRFISH